MKKKTLPNASELTPDRARALRLRLASGYEAPGPVTVEVAGVGQQTMSVDEFRRVRGGIEQCPKCFVRHDPGEHHAYHSLYFRRPDSSILPARLVGRDEVTIWVREDGADPV